MATDLYFPVDFKRGDVAGLNDGRGDGDHWAPRMKQALRSQGTPEIR